MNSNLTRPLDRYMEIAPYLDVLHISHNWGTIDDFVDGGFANMERKPSRERRAEQFQRMIDNSRALSEAGMMVSAETMLNKRILPHLKNIHKQIMEEMKCVRDENVWMLFGTLPFYPCNQNEEDTKLLNRIHSSKNVTVRNDPDSRSRLNVNIFTGEVIVTDFDDTPAMGNIQNDSLPAMLDRWLERPLAKMIGCHCPVAKCFGDRIRW
ncbi:hypothetical protein NCCP2050_30520 [Planococcus sp. NCCP-2050]|nr:hypothetical protein NCCP2050_30520 [Planococcus sp. NCCP-2050]